MAQPEAVHRDAVSFESEGTRCAAWLYRPEESTVTQTHDPPIVVMANGFGLPRRAGLPAIAERFAERGLAVLVFDYRSLGDSDGEPRNVALPFGQISDWQAAVRFARTIDDVDGERIDVWGFSLGAGGALFAAANEKAEVGNQHLSVIVSRVGNRTSPRSLTNSIETRSRESLLNEAGREAVYCTDRRMLRTDIRLPLCL